MTMHAGEHSIPLETVTLLVRDQFPRWADLPIVPVHSAGTVNSIFRIGTDAAARFPMLGGDPHSARVDLELEAAAMSELAACSPFAVPRPLGIGHPGRGYPLPWSVQTWIDGDIATPQHPGHDPRFADDLATLVAALRRADTKGRTFAGSGRGGSLQAHDTWMETCFDRSEGMLDVSNLRALWAELRLLPASGPDVMSHTDLTPMNLLVRGDRLVGVLDCGGFSPADPALDLVAAWHLLDPVPRRRFRRALGSSDLEWARGMAWALQQAMGLVWYYRETNPPMSDLGLSTLGRITAAISDST